MRHKHLLGTKDLGKDDIETILERADHYADCMKDPAYMNDTLKEMRILSLFFEDSTRTRVSFEMAARRLGAQWINIDIDRSSVTKGESLRDTILTLREIVRPSAIVIRHSERGTPEEISAYSDCPVINAGDNAHEHPTQALLDALTIKRHKGTLEGLNVAICGDVAHSRVAFSNMHLLPKLGTNVRIIAPDTFMPDELPEGVETFTAMEDGLKDCDIVMMLRIQKERMAKSDVPSQNDYFAKYGLSREKLALAKDDALVMHPGPMNRDVEIAGEVADDPQRSLILEQVANGVPTRMAVMELLTKF